MWKCSNSFLFVESVSLTFHLLRNLFLSAASLLGPFPIAPCPSEHTCLQHCGKGNCLAGRDHLGGGICGPRCVGTWVRTGWTLVDCRSSAQLETLGYRWLARSEGSQGSYPVCVSEKLWIQCSPEVKMQRVLNCNRLLCLAFSFSKCIMFSHFSYKKMAFGKTAFWKMASSVILNLAPGKTALSNLLWRMRILRRAAVIHQMMMMCEDFCNTCRSPFVLVKIWGCVVQKQKL